MATHEDYQREHEVQRGTAKSFGIVFAVVFAIVGFFRPWGFGVAAGFLVLAFVAPRVLQPFNVAWLAFGDVVHTIVNPLIMGVLFFGTVVPIGLLMRLLGKRPLALERDPDAKTYWIERTPPGPEPESLRQQF